MRTKLMVVALVALTVALSWWRHGGRTVDATRAGQSQKPVANAATSKVSSQPLLSLAKAGPRAAAPVSVPDAEFPLRLRNTAKPIAELIRDNRAILLENALIDSRVPGGVAVPQRLKSAGAPGAYIVQARSKIDLAFKRQIEAAGGVVVSYIPNNAYLVKMDDAGYQRLAANAAVQSVYAYEPYYKLDSYLLTSLTAEPIAPKLETVRVTLFAGGEQAGAEAIQKANGRVIRQDRSPFGPELIAQISSKDLVMLAQSSTVQAISRQGQFQYLNDLARERVRVAATTNTAVNYLNLYGANVYVNVNDSGVDTTHPDLLGRILAAPTTLTNDLSGHGTHVAGTIASSGLNSPNGADFRGMASQASILSLDTSGYPTIADLFETAARSNMFVFNLTNALISNNSWGFGDENYYSSSSASADAAVRDAIPGVPGEQPMILVFSAGNGGSANNDDAGGYQGSVVAPGTAKNVITVGALESYRGLTNTFTNADGSINSYFINGTDSSNEVRTTSSRGNVSPGIEGPYGRFKPDVVAPGAMMISTRSGQWDQARYYNITNRNTTWYLDVTVAANSVFQNAVYIPNVAVEYYVTAVASSPAPTTSLLIYTNTIFNPSTNSGNLAGANFFGATNGDAYFTPGVFLYYDIVNTNNFDVIFDIAETMVTTNSNGNYLTALSNLNQTLAPYYRYESGTSMSAPVVSGMLALMQELFEQQLGLTNSPAMMKALLINGAVSQSPLYDLQVQNFINHQGWGLPSLSNSISEVMQSNPANDTVWPMRLFDQSTNRFLSTGVEHDYAVSLPSTGSLAGGGGVDSTNYPLRITLVWTDPPGNPVAGIKLVNDLDLVVTNLDSGEVFYGNAFLGGSTYVSATNVSGAASNDVVNNVENVFLPPGAGRNFTVAVRGTRVNVNAVTADTNSIAQDYALVITVGEPRLQSGLTVAGPTLTTNNTSRITYLATGGSGRPMLNQRVGANASVLTSTNGATNQWVFYVVTNTTTSTNVAFVTFLPPNLSSSRISSADLDLYVSFDPDLTNLVGTVIGAAYKSVGRGGTEAVTFTNSTVGTVYYVGVKSEDQMAADFGFFAASTDDPFSRRNADGSVDVFGIALPAEIPDGNNAAPGLLQVFFVNTESIPIRRVVVTNTFTHQRPGDLEFLLEHESTNTVLKLHDEFLATDAGTYTVIYDDSLQGDITNSVTPDFPGSLQKFTGSDGIGAWILSVADYSDAFTGTVDSATIHIDQQSITNDSGGTTVGVNSNAFYYDFVDVPSGAISLTINAVNILPAGNPLQIFLRQGAAPTLTTYDLTKTVTNNGSLILTIYDNPPLQPGRYFVGFYNPNSFALSAVISYAITYDTAYVANITARSTNVTILDDARTIVSTNITSPLRVAGVEVGVRIDHPRASDLTLHLISPSGTRVLLAENRGGQSTLGYGTGSTPGSYTLTTFVTDTNLTTLPIKFDVPPFLGETVSIGSGVTFVSSNIFAGTADLKGFGIAAYNSGLYVVGVTNPAGLNEDGLILQMSLPMANNATPVWYTNFPSVAGTDSFQAVAATPNGVFAVGESLSETGDTDGTPTSKGVTVNFPLTGPSGSGAAGSSWVRQTPDTNRFGLQQTELMRAVTTLNEAGTEYVYVAGNTFRDVGGVNRNRLVLSKVDALTGAIQWSSSDTNAATPVNGNSFGHSVVTLGTNVYVAGSYNGSPYLTKFTVDGDTNGFSSSGNNPFLFGSATQGTNYGMTVFGTDIIVVGVDTSGANHTAVIASYSESGSLNWYTAIPNGGKEQEFRSVVLIGGRLYAVGSSASTIGTDDDVLIVDFDATTGVPGSITLYGGPDSEIAYSALNYSGDLYVVGSSTPAASTSSLMLLRFAIGSTANVLLPEEPLDYLVGENANGLWSLEIVDNRVGPVSAIIPKLLEWNLNLFLSSATNASTVTITPSTPVTLTVYTNQTYYFMVDVPFAASFATNLLTSISGGNLELLFNQSFLPDGSHPAGDFTLLTSTTAGNSTLSSSSGTPLLQPGFRYYLGVRNTNPTETNTFTLQVDFDSLGPSIVVLSEFHPVYKTAQPASTPDSLYQITVPSGVTAVLIEITGLTGNADMMVRKGGVPTAYTYDYRGSTPVPGSRRVYLKQGVATPDLSGTWYIAVHNQESYPQNYSLNVSYPVAGDMMTTIVPLVLADSPTLTSDGVVHVGFAGLSGETYLVEFTTDLVNWTPLKYVTAVNDQVQFTDTSATTELRFYRVRQVPASAP